jgi:hypothetical protein
MSKIDKFIHEAGNVKFRSAYRDSMYFVIKDKDETGLLSGPSNIFYVAFAIGYHFNKQEEIAKKAINHVNLVSLDIGIKELMARMVLKKKPEINNPEDLWKEVEKYAEYGIQVLFNTLQEKGNVLDIPTILEKDIES